MPVIVNRKKRALKINDMREEYFDVVFEKVNKNYEKRLFLEKYRFNLAT